MRRTDQLNDADHLKGHRSTRARRVARALAGFGLVALLAPVLAAPVGAQGPDVPPPAREYGESGVRSGVVQIRAGSTWLPVGSDGSGGGGSACSTSSIRVVVEDDFRQPVNEGWRSFGSDGTLPFAAEPGDLPASLPAAMRSFSPTGRWYEVMCDGVITMVPEGGPPITVADLILEAVNQLDPPEPELSIVPIEFHVTQLPSWLAVEPLYWDQERERTASAGRVWVTAQAEPYQAVWDPGDGTDSLTCDGPGTIWQAGLDDEANTCAYTYRRSSAGAPGDAFTLSATVTFAVTAQTNAPVPIGDLPDLERTTTVDLQVGEIQAVND